MKYLIFGTGDYYQRYKKWFNNDEIVALIDNSEEKQHKLIDGIEVLSPSEGIILEYDKIIILSFYVKSMKKQLLDLGVPRSCIYHFFQLYKLDLDVKFPKRYYGITENEIYANCSNTILLLSTDLEPQGGPATVLIRLAVILKKNGYNVVFGSMMDGKQRHKLLEANIPVVIDSNLQVKKMIDIEWTHGFRTIICNTVGFCVFLSERVDNTPIVWWLHDSSFFYDGVDKELLKNMDYKGLNLVAVGKVPRNAFHEIVPDIEIKDFLYGVELKKYRSFENLTIKDSVSDHAMVFVTLGYIENRKGQDILLKAIEMLAPCVREKALFFFIGKDTSEFAQIIKEHAKNIPEIIITGLVDEQEKQSLIDKADVLICPSREDPMPAAVTEAMMFEKMTIVSDITGTAEYIQNGINGIVFENENAKMLSEKISWCIMHVDDVKKMGKLSQRIYQEYFSMNAFEKRALELMQI